MLKKFRRGSVWHIRGTVKGITVYETTGTTDAARAEEYRAKREAQLWDRAVIGERGMHTFEEAVLIYLQNRRPGPHFRFITMRPLVAHFKAWPVDMVTQSAVDQYIDKYHSKSSPATIVRAVITPITAVLRVAARRKWCDQPAFERPKGGKADGRVSWRWLTRDEADKLVSACAPHLRPLIIFLLHTGARLGEALRLEWSEVDLAARRVAFLNTKNGESRGVPLNDEVVRALSALDNRSGHVFLTPAGEPYYNSGGLGGSPIKTAFRTACIRAGLSKVTGIRIDVNGRQLPVYKNTVRVHDLRHTFASWLVMGGTPLRTVAELLGHKTLTMVMRYSHLSPDHLREAVTRLSTRAPAVQSRRSRRQASDKST